MKDKAQEAIRARLVSVVDDRFPNKKEGCEFLVDECGFDFGPTTLRAKLRGSQMLRLREFLRVADAMNIDYVWLLTGKENGWEGVPSDRVIIGLGPHGALQLDVPRGWDPNVRLRPGREPLAVSTEREEG